MGLAIQTLEYTVDEDLTWLASQHGFNTMDTGTLDGAACVALYPTGIVPSGAKIGLAGTGRWVPYDPAGTYTRVALNGTTKDIKTTGQNTACALYSHGKVRVSKLPANVVALTAPQLTAFKALLPGITFI